MKLKGNLYHNTQITFAYNNNHIEGSKLTEDQTRYIYEANILLTEKDSITDLDDVLETANHFRLVDYILDIADKTLTDLFCDIAEYYGEKLTENTKILDICCGTGALLISSLERIRKNINARSITNEQRKEAYALAQKQSLIRVEKDSSMYDNAKSIVF